MRIRKNARLITPTSTSSCSSKSSFIVCQLNRSPWDVDSSFQGECENGFDGLAQGFPSSNSLFSVESMELSYEYVEKTMSPPSLPPPQLEFEEREKDRIGGHNDGDNNNNRNNGWQHIHHQLKPPPLKVGPPLPPVPTAPKKRGRPKKSTLATNSPTPTITATPTTNSDNPYEFYYYAGFGPSWSRRRGGNKKYATSGIADANGSSNCGNTRIIDGESSPGCSSSSLVMSEDDVKDDDDDRKNNNNNNSSVNNDNVVVMESVVEGELDYIEDDFEDDDDDDESNLGRRRVRKPVKARSLKSLM